MKKMIYCLAILMTTGIFSALTTVQTQAADAEPYEVALEGDNDMQSVSLTQCSLQNGLIDKDTVAKNCYYYYRCYYPVVYYRPVYYTYRTYRTCYYYRYRYVVFYNGMNSEKSNGSKGICMDATPKAGSPLAEQGIEKGDIITHINGKAVSSPSDIDRAGKDDKLTVLKNSVKNTESLESLDKVMSRFPSTF